MAALVPIPEGAVHLYDARRRTRRFVDLTSFRIAARTINEHEFETHSLSEAANESGSRPVTSVRWIDAIVWCNAASLVAGLDPAYGVDDSDVTWDASANGFRLPTEAEWVHAARGGVSGVRYGDVRDIAWTAEDQVAAPEPAGQKQPNNLGLYDALGNVWERCRGRLDPARDGDCRVLEGGGWADSEWSVRVGVRRGNAPDAIVEDVGFRVAQGPVEAPEGGGGQAWSEAVDRKTASIRGLIPAGWTPLAQ